MSEDQIKDSQTSDSNESNSVEEKNDFTFPSIFISYNHEESNFAYAIRKWLIDELTFASDDIFLDTEHLHAGVAWEQRLLPCARKARALIFIASKSSLSPVSICRDELEAAKGPIITVGVKGISYASEELLRALPKHAHARQVTVLDEPQDETIITEKGEACVNSKCLKGLAETLRNLYIAPDSFQYNPERGPYPGLRPLDEGDEAVFFARDTEILEAKAEIESNFRI